MILHNFYPQEIFEHCSLPVVLKEQQQTVKKKSALFAEFIIRLNAFH